METDINAFESDFGNKKADRRAALPRLKRLHNCQVFDAEEYHDIPLQTENQFTVALFKVDELG
jgi:hypothetical protein